MVQKRKHPKFLRPNFGRSSRSRIKVAWRRPRGIDNKKRLKIKYMGASPSIGYGQPSKIKHHHPQGMPEILVQSASDLAGMKGVAVRIASGVGAVKREAIQKAAESMKLRVLNARKFVPKVKKEKKPKVGNEGKAAANAQDGKKAEAPVGEKPPMQVSAAAPETAGQAKKQ